MPIPFLAAAAVAGVSLVIARIGESIGIDDPDDPGSGKLPSKWGPGQAPSKPWKADEVDNARVCWPGENGNAHLARWMNHKKGVSLPGDIQTWKASKLSAWLGTLWAGQIPAGASFNGNVVALAAEADAMMYGCMGKMAWEQIRRAPEKIWNSIRENAKGVVDDAKKAAEEGAHGTVVEGTEAEVSSSGGSVSVGGTTVASW